ESLSSFYTHRTPPPTSSHFPYTTLFRSNFIDFSQPPSSAAYESLHDWLVPTDWEGAARASADAALQQHIAEHGMRAFQQALTARSEEHTSELQSPYDLVCRLLLEKKKTK